MKEMIRVRRENYDKAHVGRQVTGYGGIRGKLIGMDPGKTGVPFLMQRDDGFGWECIETDTSPIAAGAVPGMKGLYWSSYYDIAVADLPSPWETATPSGIMSWGSLERMYFGTDPASRFYDMPSDFATSAKYHFTFDPGLPKSPKPTLMSKLVQFVKNAALSADEKLLRKHGLKTESGDYTPAYAEIRDRLLSEEYEEDVLAALKKQLAEENS